ncbi:MAG: hypothetical protein M5R36_26995 [Deltaproteobacteria bacterium]|nr:hypothetical protein [Deltaproteobacteria bacterium]
MGHKAAIYMLSPLATSGATARRASSADGFVPKPVDLGKLADLVNKRLGPGDPDLADREAKKLAEEVTRAEKAKRKEARAIEVAEHKAKEADALRDEGSIEKRGLFEVIADLAVGRSDARLEIDTTDHTKSIRFAGGLVVGLAAPDLVTHLVDTKRLTKDEAVQVQKLRRSRLGLREALLKRELFSEEKLDAIIADWRLDNLKRLAAVRSGMFRVYDGEQEKRMELDPLVLVYLSAKAQFPVEVLQSKLAETLGTDATVRLTREPGAGVDTEKTLTRIVDACRKGASLGELFVLGGAPDDVMAALVALARLGRIQRESQIAAPPPAEDENPPESVFGADTTDFAFEDEFDGFDNFDPSEEGGAESPADSDATDDDPALEFDDDDDEIMPGPLRASPNEPASDAAETEAPDAFDDGVDEAPIEEEKEAFAELFEGLSSSSQGLRKDDRPRNADAPAPAAAKAPPGADDAPETNGTNAVSSEERARLDAERALWSDLGREVPIEMDARELIRQGDAQMKKNVYGSAQVYFRIAALREPENVEAMVKLARATYRSKYLDPADAVFEAVAWCKRAAEIRPSFVPAYATLMKIFDEQGKHELSLAAGRQGLEAVPDNDELRKRVQELESAAP